MRGILLAFTLFITMLTALTAGVTSPPAKEPAWKTAYIKRGFVGNYDANWAGGLGATLRMRVPIPVAGTKVRLSVRGCWDATTELTKLALVKGADDQGTSTGPVYPITFAGQPGLTLDKGLKEATSDVIDIPMTPGAWYLEERYASQHYPYAYDIDKAFTEAGDHFGKPTLAGNADCYLGIVYRIDVLTTDKRPTVICYGDSITHGYSAPSNGGKRYPDLLAKILNRPTLNLGMNGDIITQSGGVPDLCASLPGADTVIFLMGINDIISNAGFTKETYVQCARRVIDGCRDRKLKIFLGTLPPAAGYAAFDKDPAKEQLRQAINAWIRTDAVADGVIDFDATLADPKTPGKFNPDSQSGDWLHPNATGYRKMAEAAAQVLKDTRKDTSSTSH